MYCYSIVLVVCEIVTVVTYEAQNICVMIYLNIIRLELSTRVVLSGYELMAQISSQLKINI